MMVKHKSVAEGVSIVQSHDATESSRQRYVKRFPSKATRSANVKRHTVQNAKRKGMFDMAAPLGFFMLILVFAMVLVLMKVKGLQDERPQLQADLDSQMASAMLISTLRTNAPMGYEGSGKKAPLADIIILNNDGRYDDAVGNAMKTAFGDTRFFDMKVYYPDGRVYSCKNADNFLKYHSSNDVRTAAGQAMLPSSNGVIKIEFNYHHISKNGQSVVTKTEYIWSSTKTTLNQKDAIKEDEEREIKEKNNEVLKEYKDNSMPVGP